MLSELRSPIFAFVLAPSVILAAHGLVVFALARRISRRMARVCAPLPCDDFVPLATPRSRGSCSGAAPSSSANISSASSASGTGAPCAAGVGGAVPTETAPLTPAAAL
eukprot:gnl/TRDRNA2_/TRDRNA2_160264_c0_seq3.p1 gnl/TRDRNA2_/TRDRNA2_160264_c0~~gnl/TRDRNA2_/TRDRNA2_160264_c0_seq3.p1  ORF type:complete len:108 (+),score=6.73 gnl/TRDRNA2_/TRDRNA2_160264_c0_seq3:75-398(+)